MKSHRLSATLLSFPRERDKRPPRKSLEQTKPRHVSGTDEPRTSEVAMADVLTKKCASHVRRVSTRSIEYRLIFSVCFLVFLLAGAVERLSPWSWLAQEHNAGPPSSIIAQAWGAACTCTAYAFMG
jgi:hypothetical protein